VRVRPATPNARPGFEGRRHSRTAAKRLFTVADQADLVEVRHTLRQILNDKGI
jgi:hypothetical protein